MGRKGEAVKDIYIVRVNLDLLRRKCGLCLTVEDKAMVLEGFMFAASGGEPRTDMPPRWRDGYDVGSEAYQRAKEHQLRMSELGQRSANVRSNVGSNARSSVRSDVCSNQASKPTSQQENKQEKPASQEADASPLAALKKARAQMTRKGVSIADEWEALLDTYTVEDIRKALLKKAPKDRWPSQVRAYLEEQYPGEAFPPEYPPEAEIIARVREIRGLK